MNCNPQPIAGALRSAVKTALNRSDAAWYRATLQKDVCGGKLSDNEERAVLAGAIDTAAATAERIKTRYGRPSPEELAAALSLNLAHSTAELRAPYLYMSLYEPGKRMITLNDSAISLLRQFIGTNGLSDLTPPGDIPRLALYHEIFHALEEETPGIYTRSRMLKRKALGIFPYRRGLAGASEVAAMHFSRIMAGVSYSPCIYERYLLLALGQLSIDFLPSSVLE